MTRDRSREMIDVAQTVEAIPSRTCCSEDRLGPSPLQLPTRGRPCRPVAWHCQAEWSCRPGGSRFLRQTHAVRPKAAICQAQSGLSEWSRHPDPYDFKTGRPGAQARFERAVLFDEITRDLRSVFWMRHGQASRSPEEPAHCRVQWFNSRQGGEFPVYKKACSVDRPIRLATEEGCHAPPFGDLIPCLFNAAAIDRSVVVRVELQNPTSQRFISLSKHTNFENRTKSAESRAPEINGPFGEEIAGSADLKSGVLNEKFLLPLG